MAGPFCPPSLLAQDPFAGDRGFIRARLLVPDAQASMGIGVVTASGD